MKALLYVAGVFFILAGSMYLAAATGIAFEDRLSDSAGGPWIQGLVAAGVGIAFIVGTNKQR